MTERDKQLMAHAIPEVLAEHLALLTAVCDREQDPIRKVLWLALARQAQASADNAMQQFRERATG